jgi:hypothetical protein
MTFPSFKYLYENKKHPSPSRFPCRQVSLYTTDFSAFVKFCDDRRMSAIQSRIFVSNKKHSVFSRPWTFLRLQRVLHGAGTVLLPLISSTYHYRTCLDSNLANYFWVASEPSNTISKLSWHGISKFGSGRIRLQSRSLHQHCNEYWHFISICFLITMPCKFSFPLCHEALSIDNIQCWSGYTLSEASFVCEKPLNKLLFLVTYETDLYWITCVAFTANHLPQLSWKFPILGMVLKIRGGCPDLNKSEQFKQTQKNHS